MPNWRGCSATNRPIRKPVRHSVPGRSPALAICASPDLHYGRTTLSVDSQERSDELPSSDSPISRSDVPGLLFIVFGIRVSRFSQNGCGLRPESGFCEVQNIRLY